jgi:hypothetical protein
VLSFFSPKKKGNFLKQQEINTQGIKKKQLFNQIESAQNYLFNKLIKLDLKSLNISDYNQRYLGSKISNLKSELQLYGRLLYLALNNSPISIENFVLIDYGGGSGLISFLASEMGIGTVIYNDIYDVSCSDVKILSQAIGLPLKHIVCGDIDKLVSFTHMHSISINAIVSYDVLEHIYDVEDYVKKLACISDKKFRIVYGSGANNANPRYVRSVKKIQIEAEYKNRDKKWGDKERDSLHAFLDIRKNMIAAYAPELDMKTVDQLALSTRGLIQRDIYKGIDEFRLQGKITYHMDHPTNTCDPYTGNWSEHLMDFKWLEQVFKKEGFSVKILPGLYGTYVSPLKKCIRVFLNAIIHLLGRGSLFLAPYFIVCADFYDKGIQHDNDSA